ncbi:MAG: DUF952 domain-containing protein [Flavisolibacter sp.]|jgi:uncharacterized protein (DUF952 family)|nr:DUF952 domain-containing protein [Flavisolibacter sp.]
MHTIYHITTAHEWAEAIDKGAYTAPSLFAEGFIHCSNSEQVKGVLERYYLGKTDLLLLTIDPNLLQAEIKYEHAPSVNELFPHVYGPINLDAVIDSKSIATHL